MPESEVKQELLMLIAEDVDDKGLIDTLRLHIENMPEEEAEKALGDFQELGKVTLVFTTLDREVEAQNKALKEGSITVDEGYSRLEQSLDDAIASCDRLFERFDIQKE